jgi:hypothetical protein
MFGLIRYLTTELIIVLATVSSETLSPQLMRKMGEPRRQPPHRWDHHPGPVARSTWPAPRST